MELSLHSVFQERSAGVLLHLTSLPDEGRSLDEACRFADWLAECGFRWWQMLPVGPLPPSTNSPYSCLSSFRLGNFVGGEWKQFRKHCKDVGIRLLGDVPIFVPLDSEDVQDNPHLFCLTEEGQMKMQTGVPPDMFSETGQLWGHPHYNWEAHRDESFAWWTRRLLTALDWFDAVRLDHFVGFHHAYQIAGDAKTAEVGEWSQSPGREILDSVRKALFLDDAPLPFVAEDLGAVTPEVETLRDDFGLPGIALLQESHDTENPTKVAYSGTHDTDTLLGWIESHPERFSEPQQALTSYMQKLWGSKCFLAVAPMQDLLALGSASRMNIPGTIDGNWSWRLTQAQLDSCSPEAIREQLFDSGRLASG